MKIIEVLKELPLIDKKVEKNIELLRKYSSDLIVGESQSLPFITEEKQKAEVQALLQSTEDLVKRKAYLRRVLSVTNANTFVVIMGQTKSITEWIEYRQHGLDRVRSSLAALSNNTAASAMKSLANIAKEQQLRTVLFYDEATKNRKLKELEELLAAIDTNLEMTNATVDAFEPEKE